MRYEKKVIPGIEEGNHIAIITSIIHLGQQETEFQGKKKYGNRIILGFEFPDQQAEFDGVMKPRMLSQEYGVAFGGKLSKLAPVVRAALQKNLDEDELWDTDLDTLLGKAVFAQVVVNEKGYSNVEAVTPLPKSIPAPTQFNPNKILDWGEHWSMESYKALPEFIQKKIDASPDYDVVLGKKVQTFDEAPAIPQTGTPDTPPFE